MSDEEWFASIAIAGPSRTSLASTKKSDNSHRRTMSSISRVPTEAGDDLAPPSEALFEGQKRRKRDRIRDRVSRRNKRASAHEVEEQDGAEFGSDSLSSPGVDEDDDNGQYVNYRVGFQYKRTERSKKIGYGLHVLVGDSRLMKILS